MTDPAPTPYVSLVQERRLVTFAIFAYNQEKYIHEAVKGAFAQTYQPLEIILSDDCSTDRTFEIMQEMVCTYQGPHQVKLNRNERNLHVSRHIAKVADIASGEILIMAAGDDISYANRTECLVNAFDTATYAVFSAYDIIDLNSRTVEVAIQRTAKRQIQLRDLAAGGVGAGATYAYRKLVLLWPDKLNCGLHNEDKFLPYRAGVLGKIKYISEPLLGWRRHSLNLSNTLKKQRGTTIYSLNHHLELLKILSAGYEQKYIKDADLREGIESLLVQLIDKLTRIHGQSFFKLKVLKWILRLGR